MNFFTWLFASKGPSNITKNLSEMLVKKIMSVINLGTTIKTKQKELDDLELTMALDKKEELFLSFNNFLELMETSDLSISAVLKKCQHVSELDPTNSSTVNMDTFIEDDHVVLCHDKENCLKHKDGVSNILRITSIRK